VLVLGDTATTIAARVVADAAKGRGFSLPADIQPLDARPSIGGGEGALVTLLPLREVSAKEAAAVARFAGLPGSSEAVDGGANAAAAAAAAAAPRRGGSINAMAQGFIDSLSAALPGSAFTVLRAASHLRPFDFNAPSAAGPAAAAAAAVAAGARAAGSRLPGSGGGSGKGAPAAATPQLGQWHSAASFCRVCAAPIPAAAATAAAAAAETAAAAGMQQLSITSNEAGASPPPAQQQQQQATAGPLAAATAAAALGVCYGCDRYLVRPLAVAQGCGASEAAAKLAELLPP
jgi:hypothetical protein